MPVEFPILTDTLKSLQMIQSLWACYNSMILIKVQWLTILFSGVMTMMLCKTNWNQI